MKTFYPFAPNHLARTAALAALLFSAAFPLTLLSATRPVQAQSLPGLALPGLSSPSISSPVSRLFDSVTDWAETPQAFPNTDGPVHEQWSRRWTLDNRAAAFFVAVDKNGNVFVAGDTGDAPYSTSDYRLVKYAPDGTELWNRRYDGPAHGNDEVTGLVLDAAGDAYVTGASDDSNNNFNSTTLKYAPDGTLLWSSVYGYDLHHYHNDTLGIIGVDTAGSVYLSGTIYGRDAEGYYSVYATIKYGANGHLLWASRYSGPPNCRYAYTGGGAVDAGGTVYVTGTTEDPQDSLHSACTTLKYSPEGATVWVRSSTNSTYDTSSAVALDAGGNVYVAGQGSSGALLLKYDPNGALLWTRTNSPVGLEKMAVDPMGNVAVMGGSVYASASGPYGLSVTLKYAPDGRLEWTQNNAGGTGLALTADAEGSFYVTGYTAADKTDFLLVKYGADGHQHWKRLFHEPGPESDAALAAALDDAGNVYITGTTTAGYNDIAMRTVKYSQ